MIQPDDDFDDDFDEEEPQLEVSTETIEASAPKPNQKQHDTRRRIEDILEARRLKEEFGELEL